MRFIQKQNSTPTAFVELVTEVAHRDTIPKSV
jgi:hypothetical protein